jgi:hypothetical protein
MFRESADAWSLTAQGTTGHSEAPGQKGCDSPDGLCTCGGFLHMRAACPHAPWHGPRTGREPWTRRGRPRLPTLRALHVERRVQLLAQATA